MSYALLYVAICAILPLRESTAMFVGTLYEKRPAGPG